MRARWSSVRAIISVIVKSTTTTTSIITVTASTSVVKGPFAFSSEMMAMADEGERATARHAMSRAAASCCDSVSTEKKGMNQPPKNMIETSMPE